MMEQQIKESELIWIPFVILAVWLVSTALSNYYDKKWLYVVEMMVLFVGIVVNVYCLYLSVIEMKKVDVCMCLASFATIKIAILIILMKDFCKRFYNEEPIDYEDC